MVPSITSRLALLALAAASLLGGTGCLAHESQEYVVHCNASGIAKHDFQTTAAASASHVEGLLIAPRAGRQPSSLEPVPVRFTGTVAYASCPLPGATVAFLVSP